MQSIPSASFDIHSSARGNKKQCSTVPRWHPAYYPCTYPKLSFSAKILHLYLNLIPKRYAYTAKCISQKCCFLGLCSDLVWPCLSMHEYLSYTIVFYIEIALI